MVLIPELSSISSLWIRRRKKAAELGLGARFIYSFETDDDRQIAFATIQRQKPRAQLLLRLLLASWRPFKVALFDELHEPILSANHPFRFYFQRFEIRTVDGMLFGEVERRLGFLQRRFEIRDSKGVVIFSSSCPVWRAWGFPFYRNGKEQAKIHRRWSRETRAKITKIDRFQLEFNDVNLPHEHRVLILMAALFVELTFARRKSGKRSKKKRPPSAPAAPPAEVNNT